MIHAGSYSYRWRNGKVRERREAAKPLVGDFGKVGPSAVDNGTAIFASRTIPPSFDCGHQMGGVNDEHNAGRCSTTVGAQYNLTLWQFGGGSDDSLFPKIEVPTSGNTFLSVTVDSTETQMLGGAFGQPTQMFLTFYSDEIQGWAGCNEVGRVAIMFACFCFW